MTRDFKIQGMRIWTGNCSLDIASWFTMCALTGFRLVIFLLCWNLLLYLFSFMQIWHDNMPYGKIAERKGHQGWMKQEGSYFIFPGGGTMFPDGAEQYIEKLAQYVPLKSGLLRTGLDMGCGVIL
jgi:hypothetical protein